MEILQMIVSTFGILNMTMGQAMMILISLFFMYLAIVKKYEPLLLLPLAFGILIANLPRVGLDAYHFNPNNFEGTLSGVVRFDENGVPIPVPGGISQTWVPGLMNFLYSGIRMVIYPPLVFLCLGTMTDFGPLISNPKSALIGIGGQLGIFVAFFISLFLVKYIPGFDGFTEMEAAAIGIIGSSDGPTAIYAATRLAPHLLPPIAIAAFSYMALVPFIQPPIMRLLITKKERVIVMPEPKRVTQKQKIIFPIVCTIVTLLFVPAAGALISMLMLGNLIRESGIADRYVRAFQNDLLSILTFLVALSIGSSAQADTFLQKETLIIIACGLLAFAFGTFGGILVAKLLCFVTGGKVNPLIGNSGVSAMPMAARISQKMGQKFNTDNHLLMHAMGPIVSSTIGSAIVAGIFISYFTK
ncbi:MAG: sodium ion-translocating decarboxylase subunit beta [Treponema sp.]|nr:sodium ion-translocating decarboxylase subunit beta [Treponema sp.]